MRYEDWKGWSTDGFGGTSTADAAYFDAEIFNRLGLPPAARLLEVGFGNGNFMGHARRLGHSVTGIETNAELQRRAQAAGFDVCGSPAELANGAFDAVVAFDVLEHVPVADTVDFLTAIARSVKSGGYIVLRFPNGDSPFGRAYQYGDSTHVNVIGSIKIGFVASAAGLSVVSVKNPERPRAHLGARRQAGEIVRKIVASGMERALGWTFFGSRLPMAPN